MATIGLDDWTGARRLAKKNPIVGRSIRDGESRRRAHPNSSAPGPIEGRARGEEHPNRFYKCINRAAFESIIKRPIHFDGPKLEY